jgi:hydrogenase-4 membrane subunit HyfE
VDGGCAALYLAGIGEVYMLALLAIVQLILHYLGWLGVILGIVAFLFGNRDRALELVVGGVGLIVLKYVLGFIFLGLFGLGKKRDAESPRE